MPVQCQSYTSQGKIHTPPKRKSFPNMAAYYPLLFGHEFSCKWTSNNTDFIFQLSYTTYEWQCLLHPSHHIL